MLVFQNPLSIEQDGSQFIEMNVYSKYMSGAIKANQLSSKYYRRGKIPSCSFILRIHMDTSLRKIPEIFYDVRMNSSEPEQKARLYWLIWVYTGRKCLMVGFRRAPLINKFNVIRISRNFRYLSRSTRKPTLWTQIRLRCSRRLIRSYTFRLMGKEV